MIACFVMISGRIGKNIVIQAGFPKSEKILQEAAKARGFGGILLFSR